jgi:hypothetical protein
VFSAPPLTLDQSPLAVLVLPPLMTFAGIVIARHRRAEPCGHPVAQSPLLPGEDERRH